jgi:hypothetical protein
MCQKRRRFYNESRVKTIKSLKIGKIITCQFAKLQIYLIAMIHICKFCNFICLKIKHCN